MAKHAFASELIKPVQRIMRYHLLLKVRPPFSFLKRQEMVKYTPSDKPGCSQLESALQKMKDAASSINEIKRQKENQRTLLALQERIEGYEVRPKSTPLYQGPEITSYGALLQDGKMVMVERQSGRGNKIKDKDANGFHFFLFEDVILYCKDVSKKNSATGYKFKGLIPISLIVVRERISDLGDSEGNVHSSMIWMISETKFAWELMRMDLQKSYIMTCATYEEKDRWLNLILENIEKSATKPVVKKGLA
jgi:hypothetical protein